jgi:hypothetical protein
VARRNSKISFLSILVLCLAVYGGYVLCESYAPKATHKTVKKIDKVITAAKSAW